MLNIKIYNTNVYIAVRNEVWIIPRRHAIVEIYTWRSFWKNFLYLSLYKPPGARSEADFSLLAKPMLGTCSGGPLATFKMVARNIWEKRSYSSPPTFKDISAALTSVCIVKALKFYHSVNNTPPDISTSFQELERKEEISDEKSIKFTECPKTPSACTNHPPVHNLTLHRRHT